MTPAAAALAQAARRVAAVSDTPRLDAELLLAHALGVSREQLLLAPPRHVPASFAALVARRAAGEPLAYITGRRAFWTIDLEVGPGALIPRPDSETLIAAAVAHFTGTAGPKRILDLGTGPGTLLLAALDQWPGASGLGIEASPDALGYARRNAERLGFGGRAELRGGDWAEGVTGRFDLLLCNPPYIADSEPVGPGVAKHEPHGALFAGADGLDSYRRLAPEVGRLLMPDGIALFEIGHAQADSAAALFRAAGWSPELLRDLAGRPRALRIRH